MLPVFHVPLTFRKFSATFRNIQVKGESHVASTTDAPVKQRAVASGVAVTLGLATVVVDFVPAATPNKDKASQFHSLCTDCETPTRLHQKLLCPDNAKHGPFSSGDIVRRGKEIDGNLVEVTQAEIDAVRGGGDDDSEGESGPKALNLTVVRTPALMNTTLNGDTVYRLRANAKTTTKKGYALLTAMVTQALRTGRVLIGEFSVRGTSRLFWLSVRHGQIIAQSLMRPDDIAPFDTIDTEELPEKTVGMVGQLIEQFTVEFDPEAFRNKTRERAEQLIAAKSTEPGASITALVPQAKPAASDDLESLLSSMLAS